MSADIIEIVDRSVAMEDLIHLAENMREADKVEIHLSHNQKPLESLVNAAEDSKLMWMAKMNDQPIALFGVASQTIFGDTGSPWLLGTDDLKHVKIQFIRESKRLIRVMQKRYPTLVNFVHADHADSIRWLKCLGFTIMEPIPAGPFGAPFCKFERLADV